MLQAQEALKKNIEEQIKSKQQLAVQVARSKDYDKFFTTLIR